ncbi:hypothetical protein NE287_00380 [Pediococcus pentosaceus]|nr:hypothetical protein [Pediococcus pentosaceus]
MIIKRAAVSRRELNETFPSFTQQYLPKYGQPEVNRIDNLPVAIDKANQVFERLDSAYASGLTFMRGDRLSRTFRNDQGQVILSGCQKIFLMINLLVT